SRREDLGRDRGQAVGPSLLERGERPGIVIGAARVVEAQQLLASGRRRGAELRPGDPRLVAPLAPDAPARARLLAAWEGEGERGALRGPRLRAEVGQDPGRADRRPEEDAIEEPAALRGVRGCTEGIA